VGIRPRGDAGRRPVDARVQPDVDLVVVEVAARHQHAAHRAQLVRMRVLRVQPLLQPRIVLLEGIAADRVVQVKGEVGIEIE